MTKAVADNEKIAVVTGAGRGIGEAAAKPVVFNDLESISLRITGIKESDRIVSPCPICRCL